MPVDDLARLRALHEAWMDCVSCGCCYEHAAYYEALPVALKRLERAEAALREVRAELAEVNALALDE
jgi:hypothetical protein